MQSSVRSETPRLVSISANPSSTSIPLNGGLQIDREVVVTSHVKHPGRRASYSPVSAASRSFGHVRAHSQEPRRGGMNRWDSSRPDRAPRQQPRVKMSQWESEPEERDTNRESMIALAEFLMTREPPPSNWVSELSDDEISLRSLKHFKMFGSLNKKRKKKASRSPKLLQLPDVAVAATTLQGSRHIAISIPLEHDHPELQEPSPDLSNKRPKTAPKLHGSEKAAVTVLKPVVEVRESSSFSPTTNEPNAVESSRVRAASVTTPIDNHKEILGAEATRTLEKYYRQLHQQKPSREIKRSDPNRGRIYLGEPSAAAPSTDPRHSGGTIYSTLTISTPTGHSRGASSVSTAPSVIPIAGLRLELPPRQSSKSTIPASIGEELRIESSQIANPERKPQVPQPSNGSLKSDSSHTPTVIGTGTAETAQGYHSPGPQYFSRTNTPSASAAPTKKLPDLPVGPDGQVIRPSTAPFNTSSSSLNLNGAKRTSSMRDIPAGIVDVHQQTRQERVKARKQRDMAAIRARVDDQTPGTTHIKHASRSSKHISSQGPVISKRSLNSFTPIMLVANLPPFTGVVLTSDLPSPPPLKNRPSGTSTVLRIPTPPRSIHEIELGSDSDTIPSPQSRLRKIASSSLDARRQERRTKRNMTLHEKELDARLSKIEKDNKLLLNTLTSIASSFGQLKRLMPEGAEESGMEPLMRELSGGSERRRRLETGEVEIR